MAKKPLGPVSPPPGGRGENRSGHDLTILKNELEHELRLRETILWSNGELERIVRELEEEISELEAEDPNVAEPWNEWWVRLEVQRNLNEQLEQQRGWLELELEDTNQKMAAALADSMQLDLDSLSETELIRLVKRLERQRTDLHSNLRNLEWRLDREGREHNKLCEMRSMYQAEVQHYTRTLERLKKVQKSATAAHASSNLTSRAKEIKLPPLEVVQPPQASRWGNSSPTRRNFNPHKGPLRRTAGVRNLPKIQDKKITTPRGKVDKRSRRVRSGNKDKKKQSETERSVVQPEVAPEKELTEVVPDQEAPMPSLIMKTISELAQRPLEIVETDFVTNFVDDTVVVEIADIQEEQSVFDEIQEPEVAFEIAAEQDDDNSPKEFQNLDEETNNKLADDIVEKTEEIKLNDEIECN